MVSTVIRIFKGCRFHKPRFLIVFMILFSQMLKSRLKSALTIGNILIFKEFHEITIFREIVKMVKFISLENLYIYGI